MLFIMNTRTRIEISGSAPIIIPKVNPNLSAINPTDLLKPDAPASPDAITRINAVLEVCSEQCSTKDIMVGNIPEKNSPELINIISAEVPLLRTGATVSHTAAATELTASRVCGLVPR